MLDEKNVFPLYINSVPYLGQQYTIQKKKKNS